jgi:hypothetical protein
MWSRHGLYIFLCICSCAQSPRFKNWSGATVLPPLPVIIERYPVVGATKQHILVTTVVTGVDNPCMFHCVSTPRLWTTMGSAADRIKISAREITVRPAHHPIIIIFHKSLLYSWIKCSWNCLHHVYTRFLSQSYN